MKTKTICISIVIVIYCQLINAYDPAKATPTQFISQRRMAISGPSTQAWRLKALFIAGRRRAPGERSTLKVHL